MNKKLKPGEPWYPIFRVYDEDEDGVRTAKDCTGMSLVWFFKRSKLETETAVTFCLTNAKSVTNNRSSASVIPNPPTSLSVASRMNSSFAHAVGENRRTGFWFL